MKYIILTLLIANIGYASCKEETSQETQEVVHKVDTQTPSHLKGAKITITLADGSSSTVPAEKFMVVPRKQLTVVGENKTVKQKLTCSGKEKKNIVMLDAERQITDLNTSTEATATGVTARTRSERTLVPGVNYYRRQLFDTAVGAGVGVDANGNVKGMIGLDF